MNKVLFCIGSRANYASSKSIIKACINHPNIITKVVVYASAASNEFGQLTQVMSNDGVVIDNALSTLLVGDSPQQMAESTGLALMKLPQIISDLSPDVVVTVGDRFETLAVAIATSYMNTVLAHTMGGEVTGSIDESIRHAITKLAHLHFPATELAAQNIRKMGDRWVFAWKHLDNWIFLWISNRCLNILEFSYYSRWRLCRNADIVYKLQLVSYYSNQKFGNYVDICQWYI